MKIIILILVKCKIEQNTEIMYENKINFFLSERLKK